MPRAGPDGTYRTTPHVASPAGSMAVSPAPNGKAKARAEVSESGSGYDGSTPLADHQMDVIAQVVAEESAGAEKKLRAAVAALREEFEITVAVCRDEMLAKIDAKSYGAALLDETSEIAKRAVRELRIDLDERGKITKARLDVVSERLDAFEREAKSRELATWRGFASQLARQHGKLHDLEAKLDQLAQAVRDLYEGLGEQPPRALLPLALPAPGADA